MLIRRSANIHMSHNNNDMNRLSSYMNTHEYTLHCHNGTTDLLHTYIDTIALLIHDTDTQ